MRRTLFLFLFIAALALSLSLGFAQQGGTVPKIQLPDEIYSQFGHIIGLETGGRDHPISVKLDAPVVPGSGLLVCKITDAGYALDPEAEGTRFHEAVILGAFLAGKKVRVLIDGCFKEKPLIIAVGIGSPVK